MPKRKKKAPHVEFNPQNHYEHGRGMKSLLKDTYAGEKIRDLVTQDYILKSTNPSHRLS